MSIATGWKVKVLYRHGVTLNICADNADEARRIAMERPEVYSVESVEWEDSENEEEIINLTRK